MGLKKDGRFILEVIPYQVDAVTRGEVEHYEEMEGLAMTEHPVTLEQTMAENSGLKEHSRQLEHEVSTVRVA